MKICPTCSKKFDDKYKFCPEDGTLLVSVVEEKDPMVGKVLKNKYTIEMLVMENSISRTFKGIQKPLGRKVFIEIFNKKFTLKDKFREKLEEAIKKYSNLQHGNITVVYDLDETEDGRFYVVSEYIEGKYLSDILSEGSLSEERAINIFYQITDALYLAHKNLIEHGFLTPNQIIINTTPDGKEVAQIYNFGISKLLLEEKIEKYFSENEKVFTIDEVLYLAPEQIKPNPEIDDLSDIYSLGVMMYHALAGFPPFKADSPEAMIEAILTLEPVPLSKLESSIKVSINWDAIILKCLAKNKEDRFQSASEVKKELIKLKKILEKESEPTIKVIAEEKEELIEKEKPVIEAEKTTILGKKPEIHHKSPKLSETIFVEDFQVEEKLKEEEEKKLEKEEETVGVSIEKEGEEEVEKTEIVDQVLEKIDDSGELTLSEVIPPEATGTDFENAETVMVSKEQMEEVKKGQVEEKNISDKTVFDFTPEEKVKKESEVKETPQQPQEIPEIPDKKTVVEEIPEVPPPPPPVPEKKPEPKVEEQKTPEIKLKEELPREEPTEENIIYEDVEEENLKKRIEKSAKATSKKEMKKSKTLFIVIGIVGIFLIVFVLFLLFLLKNFFTPHFGTLEIKSNPPAAKIYLDGAPIGNTPFLQEKIDTGKHLIVLRKEGFRTARKEIDIESGKKVTLEVTLEPYESTQKPQGKMIGVEEINNLEEKAKIAYDEKRIFSPEDDCALYYCEEILKLDPENDFALSLKDKILNEKLTSIKKAARRGNWYLVKKETEILKNYFPENEEVNNLFQKAEKKIALYYKRKKQTILKYKKLAEKAMRDKRYVTPPGDNAVEYLQQILKLDRSNSYAKRNLRKVKDAASFQIDTAIINSKWDRANEIAKAYLTFFPKDYKIKKKAELIKQKYKEYLKKLEAERKKQQKEEKIKKAKEKFLSGVENYKKGKYQIAIKELLTSIPELPDPSKAYFYLGACYIELKEIDKSIFYLKKAFSLNKRDYTAAYELGTLYLSKGEYEKAIKYFKIAKKGIVPGVSTQKIEKLYQKSTILLKMSTIFRTSIPAEHKHFIGSCSGYIVFTENTFRYEPTSSSHYLKLNLKDMKDVSFGETSGFYFKYRGKKYKYKIKDHNKFIVLKTYFKKYLELIKK